VARADGARRSRSDVGPACAGLSALCEGTRASPGPCALRRARRAQTVRAARAPMYAPPAPGWAPCAKATVQAPARARPDLCPPGVGDTPCRGVW